jgi:hypothetical protein
MTKVTFVECTVKGIAEVEKHLGEFHIEKSIDSITVDLPQYRVEWELRKLRKPFSTLKRQGKAPWNGITVDGVWLEHNLNSEY